VRITVIVPTRLPQILARPWVWTNRSHLPSYRRCVRSSTLRTIGAAPGTRISTQVPRGTFLGAATVTPTAGSRPDAVTGDPGPQQTAQAQ
jgi:hypothetical protein